MPFLPPQQQFPYLHQAVVGAVTHDRQVCQDDSQIREVR
jgi:hypothetical protein